MKEVDDRMIEIAQAVDLCRQCSLGDRGRGPVSGRWWGRPAEDGVVLVGMNPNRHRAWGDVMSSWQASRWIQAILDTLGEGSAWLTNLVKCPTDDNQIGFPESMACGPWLHREVVAAAPWLVILSGSPVGKFFGIEHGRARMVTYGDRPVLTVSLYHFAHSVRFNRVKVEMGILERVLRDEGRR